MIEKKKFSLLTQLLTGCLLVLGTVSAAIAVPNLTKYTPTGWPDALVAHTAQAGSENPTDEVLEQGNTYFSLAFQNNGSTSASAFNAKLYIDSIHKWTCTSEGMPNGYYAFCKDLLVNVAPGVHTVMMVIDADNQVSESNESDNAYSVVRTWVQPNLTWYTLSVEGWPDALVVHNTPAGTRQAPPNEASLAAGRTYFSLAVRNTGAVSANAFNTKLYVDNVHISTCNRATRLANAYAKCKDLGGISVAPGTHTVKMVVDADNQVSETDESDNVYSIERTWLPSVPDIRVNPTSLISE